MALEACFNHVLNETGIEAAMDSLLPWPHPITLMHSSSRCATTMKIIRGEPLSGEMIGRRAHKESGLLHALQGHFLSCPTLHG